MSRLPMLFGDTVTNRILELKVSEAEKLVRNKKVSLAAVLSSYQHNQFLSEEEAKYRAIKIAEVFIKAGYIVSRCEHDGKSTAKILEDWQVLDADMKFFLRRFLDGKNLYSCDEIE